MLSALDNECHYFLLELPLSPLQSHDHLELDTWTAKK